MENYEEKYNAALEKLQEALAPTEDGRKISGLTRNCIEEIFPELKESEGERIKKAIMHVLYENYTDAAVIEGVEIAEIVAWLEKQGKALDPDKVIEWLECDAFQSWGEPIDIRPIIRKFKKDFGL